MTQTIDFIHTYIEEKHVEFRGNRNEQEFSELSSANGLLLSSANAGILSAGFTWAILPAAALWAARILSAVCSESVYAYAAACIFQPLSNPKA